MANPVWGMLEKAQDDDETIEQAIARLILEHEQDEESHLGVGESLQSHKAAVIIDHLAASIIQDKIKDGEITNVKIVDELTGKTLTGGLIRTAASGERVEIEGGSVRKIKLFDTNGAFIGELGAPYDEEHEGGLFQIKLGVKGVLDFKFNDDEVGYLNIFGVLNINTDDNALIPINSTVRLGGPNDGERYNQVHSNRLCFKNYASIPNEYHWLGDVVLVLGILRICVVAGTPGTFEAILTD